MFSWKKKEVEEVKVIEDLDAIISFLKEIRVNDLIQKLEKMKDLSKEEAIITEPLKNENLTKQVQQMDQLLLVYNFLENDVDINGVRLRRIAVDLLRKAKQKQLNNLVQERKNKMDWRI